MCSTIEGHSDPLYLAEIAEKANQILVSSVLRDLRCHDSQKASMVWSIGTQPVIPAVYGVKAPL